jgi:hypothetical protein
MTTICPETAVAALHVEDAQLDAEMAAAAACADALEGAGLRVRFDDDPDAPLAIVLERPPGEPLRRLTARELLALVTLDPARLRAWAERPELPIPGSEPR